MNSDKRPNTFCLPYAQDMFISIDLQNMSQDEFFSFKDAEDTIRALEISQDASILEAEAIGVLGNN